MNKLDRTIEKAASNERINFTEALTLLNGAELLTLASFANKKRQKLNPEAVVTFVVDRNINYTNICISGCLFCAFYCPPGHADAYVISKEELKEKIEETLSLGGTQILLQGGLNPSLQLDYYIDLLKFIKDSFPIHIHGFSPPEIAFIAEKSALSLKDTINKLIDAGLGSIPGGGAEILVDEIREKTSPNKCQTDKWLEVMKTAHNCGLRTTATMMFGHIERPEHIIEHLMKIRNLQDNTGGFTAFIPWTFQPDNTRIEVQKTTSVEYLRVLAVSRLFLDNIQNIQASWVTQGDKIAQLALAFGANDLGSTMIEENVVAATGVKFRLPKEEMIRLIQEAGYTAAQRDCFYNILDNSLTNA
ncbi:MAG: dehypoxanthine futalosine cyclase [Desulfobacteraceae bacterium]|nr:dehypoxanthine futalosine cyclase [Pseudomonadota bacterium]MBU4257913.1 dehypoxanthine futalosine cyclase [Pseudomonadota bacterium]MBU4388770.1 dehypoxanthine futalosine cyclase [Pseudomonadota bacterium]MBU4413883.1 dehypoxanthine futalosine cyclase [Pseudomonadota bacterium]MCG2758044.1 dehypoxanthine futalosine cyclase [Desulfobacteraceae bacterium]